jgi:spectinomycin phosphotransferase
MKNEQAIEQLIISSLQNSYGIEVAHITPLALGADANALIYKVQTPDQTPYFVKLKRGRRDSSANLQLLLHNAGIKEVITPIKTVDDQPKLYVQDFTLTIYPFIDGRDGFSQSLTNTQWITLGKALRQVHQLKLPASIAQSIKQEDFSPKWRNKVKSIYATIEDAIPSDEIASKFLTSLKKQKSVILQLTDKAEELATIITEQSTDFVLCHGDIHAGNVLIANDGRLYIVDWDEPVMAPRERDLMFIGAGIGNVWNRKQETEQFYAGYGDTKINQDLIEYYRGDRILQDVVEFYEQLLSDNVGYKDHEVGYNHFLAMFEPNGVVDIALKN